MREGRWLEDEHTNEDLRQLLRAAPVPRAMTAPERARSARALRNITALPVAAGLMFWIKNVAIAGVLGATGGLVVSGAVVLATNTDAPGKEPARTLAAPSSPPQLVSALASVPTAVEAIPAPEEPKRSTVRAPGANASASPEPGDSLALETQRLEAARSVLTADPNRALTLLAAHATEFPGGKLSGERELLAIDALGRAGRQPEARARAEAMLKRQPTGLYADRLRRMLAQMH